MIDLSQTLEQISAHLISVNSVIGNEKNLCDLLELTLKKYPFCKIVRHQNSLVVRIDNQKERTVAFVGHIDTVPLTREDQTTPEFKDGWLWGLGACDMKSGLACLLKMVDDFDQRRIVPKHNTVLVFYESEEGPIPNGINILLDKGALQGIDFAFVLEPTECRYSVGCLGTMTVKKEVRGISAHSANPRMGKSALLEAAEIINAVKKADKELSQDQKIDGFQFYETINVTQVVTENASNVIPQKALVTINFRYCHNRTAKEAEQMIYDVIGGNEGVYYLDICPACYIGDAASHFLQDGIKREIMQAWTDIAQLNQAGIPAVNYGAGSILVAHKPEERINIAELQEFYKKLITHS